MDATPTPFQATERIPETLPFTVRDNPWRGWAHVLLCSAAGIPVGFLLFITAPPEGAVVNFLWRAAFAVELTLLVFALVVTPIALFTRRRRVQLACGAAGIWVTVAKVKPVTGMWLPWEAVAHIRAHTFGSVHIRLEPTPEDPYWRAAAAKAPVDLGRKRWFVCATKLGDTPQHEILSALDAYAAGRCEVSGAGPAVGSR